MEAVETFLQINSGYGYGYDYGSGYGDGDGDGDGYGDGNGDGDGYGSGIKSFCNNPIYLIDGIQTILSSIKGNIAKGFILQSDLTLKPCFVVKGKDLFAHGDTLKEALSALKEKMFNTMSVEDRIVKFKEHFDFTKKYVGTEFFSWHNILTGSCKTGRESFCKDREIDLTKKYTVQEFVVLTKDSYGGEIIKKLI